MMMMAKLHDDRSGQHSPSVHDIERAGQIIKQGGVVAFPTETVYGLGANVYNAEAVATIFEIKARPRFDPLIVHIAEATQLHELAVATDARVCLLTKALWPGPLTVVLRKREIVPDIVTAGLDTVALRMPNHETALALIREAGVPIAAPSANRFGEVSPTTADHVRVSLADRIPIILDGGPCTAGVESTIISLIDNDDPVLLRPGAAPVEDIENIIGPVRRINPNHTTVKLTGNTPATQPSAPGMLSSHYATSTPLIFIRDMNDASTWDKIISIINNSNETNRRIGLMCLGNQRAMVPLRDEWIAAEEILAVDDSPAGLRQAGVNLFAAMRRLDDAGLVLIVAMGVPEIGVGLAVNDRMRRASHKLTELT